MKRRPPERRPAREPSPTVLRMEQPSEPRVVSTVRGSGGERQRHPFEETKSSWWLDRVRELSCRFCTRPGPSSAHHFPPKGSHGGTINILTAAACGDGVAGCHGRAQRYEIEAERQALAVGETIADVILGALETVGRHDWRELVLMAIISRLREHGDQR